MLKFFRRIRKKLLSTNNFRKYFLYAAGEILLVVVGILIALQINNWNEARKSAEKTRLLFAQVQKELAFNIQNTFNVSNLYRNKDSLVRKILEKNVTYNDYKENRTLSGFIIGSQLSVGLSDEEYINLMQNGSDFTSDQQVLITKLKSLYGNSKRVLDFVDEDTREKFLDFRTKLKNEKRWFYNWAYKQETTDEMVTYLLNDPIYLNEVVEYQNINLGTHSSFILRFQHEALELYNEISNDLNLDKETSIVGDLKDKLHYAGTYHSDELNETYVLRIENDNLTYVFSRNNNARKKRNLYPRSETYFSLPNFFGKLTYDQANNVNGFIRSKRGNERFYKKIE